MALSFNTFSKTGIITALQTGAGVFASTSTLKLYPSTVAFPSSPINATGATPAGHIASYTGLTFSISGNTIYISAGTTSANTTAAGTFTWWALQSNTSGQGSWCSDSMGLSGEGKILTVNTMTPTNGQSVSITFNLTMA
jgi:hypothetical protein